jgi:hypothetical protein
MKLSMAETEPRRGLDDQSVGVALVIFMTNDACKEKFAWLVSNAQLRVPTPGGGRHLDTRKSPNYLYLPAFIREKIKH